MPECVSAVAPRERTGTGEKENGEAQSQVHGAKDALRLSAFLTDHLGAEFDLHFGNVDLGRVDPILLPMAANMCSLAREAADRPRSPVARRCRNRLPDVHARPN